jgi:multiple antibiotic resistance protein
MIELLTGTATVLFVVVDPVGLAALFAGLTHGGTAAYRRRMAWKGTAVAAVILVAFAVLGDALFRYLGVGLPAFRIAGGALLFLLAIDMVFARQSGLRSTTLSEQAEAQHRSDISVFPLGIPLIAGPGALTTVLLVVNNHRGDVVVLGALLAVIAAVMVVTLLSLLLSAQVMRLLGETGANVISRVLGVVLAALAIQFILDGLLATFGGR